MSQIEEMQKFDVVIVGGGHAGVEAALVCSRLGCRTALVASNPLKIGVMPCNPSIGGPAKSHLVREIDAMGGEMGRAIDDVFIHIRRLNTGKGQAVQALRAQADRPLYNRRMVKAVCEADNVTVITDTVVDIMSDNNVVKGVTTASGLILKCHAIVVCTGTFLAGTLHTDKFTLPGGRAGEAPAFGLSDALRNLGLKLGRLKTGTCPRLHRDTVCVDGLDILPCSSEPLKFSDLSPDPDFSKPTVDCYITRTTEETRRVIMNNLDRSPLYDGSGSIVGTGPRYCPSIEDKFVRFPDRKVHLVFLEPEGINADEIYLQGVSTSMPLDVQYAVVRSLPGLEKAEIIRPGYAVEYDYVLPTQLDFSLGVRHVKGLYLAGQINGTSGYEEAAAQGLIAGLNAARFLDGKEPFIVRRDQGYIGVLIDDLVCRGTSEPYRMHTSRAEYRLLLREDNADERLTPQAKDMGIISDERWNKYLSFKIQAQQEIERLRHKHLNSDLSVKISDACGTKVEPGPALAELLHRSYISLPLIRQCEGLPSLELRLSEKIEAAVKYEGYIERQQREVNRMSKLENTKLDGCIDYASVIGMSAEAVEKLSRIRPYNIGQASRIPGISPSDINALMIHLRRSDII
ncbi:MAG: tRNA uridine-5-carboxymethylaminomethyl(34) synthesis enzyme MnmG [Candidatus Bruticola sp.]